MNHPDASLLSCAGSLLQDNGFFADPALLAHSTDASCRQLLGFILSKVTEGIFVLDHERRYVCVNRQFLHITQLTQNNVLGNKFSAHLIGMTDSRWHKQWHKLLRHIESQLLQHQPINEQFALPVMHGPEVFVQLQIVCYQPDAASQPRYIGLLNNLTEHRQSHEVLGHTLNYDKLTGLQQRDAFIEMAALALQAFRPKMATGQLVLLRINIDKLQSFNESLGIGVTDDLIKACAQRIQRVTLPSVTLHGFSRFGGDNFGLLLAVPDIGAAHDYVAALQHAFEQSFDIHDNQLYIRLSVGISAYPRSAHDVESLLIQAEAALKQARMPGRDDVIWYHVDNHPSPIFTNTHLKSAFKDALMASHIKPFYQPKVIFTRQDTPIFEALVRWDHPMLGLINPQQFLDEILESLPHELFEGVLTACIQQLQHWQARGHMAIICINVDGRQLRSERFINFVEAQLAQHKGLAQFIEFELTEISQIIDDDAASAGLNRLHLAGVRLAIDDFGTGYSSLSYLVKYPIHTIKLDKLFIDNIAHDTNKQSLVKALIAMAHSLGIEVIAEGVETAEELAFLQSPEVNCDGAQGYIFGKPMSAIEATDWLERQRKGDHLVAN